MEILEQGDIYLFLLDYFFLFKKYILFLIPNQ